MSFLKSLFRDKNRERENLRRFVNQEYCENERDAAYLRLLHEAQL